MPFGYVVRSPDPWPTESAEMIAKVRTSWFHLTARPTRALFFALAIMMGAGVAIANGQSLDNLKGYSIEVAFGWNTTFRDLGTQNIGHATQKRFLHLYISELGRIFEYTNAHSMGGEDDYSVTALDKAGEREANGLYAWSVIDGQLTRIRQMNEGQSVFTIAIDKDKQSCEFERRDIPDEKTGRVIDYAAGRPLREIVQRTLTFSRCSIKRGNIFANDPS